VCYANYGELMRFSLPLLQSICLFFKIKKLLYFKKEKTIVLSKNIFILLLLIVAISIGATKTLAVKHRTDWFHDARWGVMTHYLTTSDVSAKKWNDQINSFDVKDLAQQLKKVGAKYYMISIGQNSGHYCAPNSKYDYHTRISPSKCSRRDLVSDIYDAISPFGIKLMVYLPANAPANDSIAVSELGWINGGNRNQIFQTKWESVIKEWSLRWGNKVSGWWFDGVNWPNEMYNHNQPPNFTSFVAAARAGNSESIIAFNPGPQYPLVSLSDNEDYTAGEVFDARGIDCESRWVKKSQLHIMSYLGSSWASGLNRYKNRQVVDITRRVNKCGGVITWDVPIQVNGHIPEMFISQLVTLKSGSENKSLIQASVLIPPGNVASEKKARLLDLIGKKDLPVNGTRHFAGLGVDGDPNTFALAGNEWSWTYQVDLAKVYSISRISVTFGPTFATEYKIIYSKDGTYWHNLKHKKNANGGKHTYGILPTKMRYLRIQGIKPDSPNQPGVQMSIAEVEAYQ
jgi:F5/8 type C domain/Alpha-L-fucosidase